MICIHSGRSRISRWGGGADLRCRCFLVKKYAKTRELGPVGGVHRARPLDPPMMQLFDLQKKTMLVIEMHLRMLPDSLSFLTPSRGLCSITLCLIIYNCRCKCQEKLKNSRCFYCQVWNQWFFF